MNSFEKLINGDQPVLVDFFATWCGPCKAMSPELIKLSGMLKEKVKIIKVDVDKNQGVSSLYGIQGVPTLILFKQGKILWKQSGAQSANALEKILTPFIH